MNEKGIDSNTMFAEDVRALSAVRFKNIKDEIFRAALILIIAEHQRSASVPVGPISDQSILEREIERRVPVVLEYINKNSPIDSSYADELKAAAVLYFRGNLK